MRHRIFAVGVGAVLSLAGMPATAMPVAPGSGVTAPIEFVADGCGRGNFRDRFGYCRQRPYGPPPGYGPPQGYGPGYGPPRAYGPPPGYYQPPPPPRFYNPYY